MDTPHLFENALANMDSIENNYAISTNP